MNSANQRKSLINALPIVAAALGKKHGVRVSFQRSAHTASTDGKQIILPLLPETDEAVVLARGYIDHECAHIRYTNFDLNFGKGLRHSLFNILEDIRIEQRLGRELPGCRINLLALEEAFVDGNVYEVVQPTSHPAAILCARLHHCLRVEVLDNQCTTALAKNAREVFKDAFPKEMVKAIDNLLVEAHNLRDSEHVLDLVDRILAASSEPSPEEESQPGQEGTQGQTGDSESQEDDSQQGGSDGQAGGDESSQEGDSQQGGSDGQAGGDESSQDGNSQQGGSDGQAGGDESSQEGDSQQGGSDGQAGGDESSQDGNSQQGGSDGQAGGGEPTAKDGSQSTGSENGRDSTDNQASGKAPDRERQEENRKKLLETKNDDVVEQSDLGEKIAEMLGHLSYEAQCSGQASGTFPQVIPQERGLHIDPAVAARETNALRTRLNGLVQASKQKRSPPRRVGARVDTRSLHKLRTLDTRVFRGREEKTAVNTGVVVLLDQSGSMRESGLKEEATKAAMAIALALEPINGVKLCIGGFRKIHKGGPVVSPMKEFHQRVNKRGFIPVGAGGTPLAEGLWWAASELLTQQHIERRVVITITDGKPENPDSVRDLVGRMKDASIETHAIGIGHQVDSTMIPSNCSIADISELPTQVFGMLQDMLAIVR